MLSGQVLRPLSNANILIFGEKFLVCPDSGHGFVVCLFVYGDTVSKSESVFCLYFQIGFKAGLHGAKNMSEIF